MRLGDQSLPGGVQPSGPLWAGQKDVGCVQEHSSVLACRWLLSASSFPGRRGGTNSVLYDETLGPEDILEAALLNFHSFQKSSVDS